MARNQTLSATIVHYVGDRRVVKLVERIPVGRRSRVQTHYVVQERATILAAYDVEVGRRIELDEAIALANGGAAPVEFGCKR